MSSDGSQRFTEREVAMVIHAASEIDEKEDSERSAALSVSDLDEITREVRISPEAISNNSSAW